ncbi:GDCCVxC domain-containing (seleno)protein [Thiomonas sp. FB-6]|uniref:GDCCVxC domain-containing (seleno)protein n=1 Tax=Thiomonas sp. FB-6 TaxID=1158291 RepID=UPI0009DB7981|nr:GDCCVxC domain-containing (seleno)protein [Thiomonas sp. FB-6]
MNATTLESLLTCPQCGFATLATMPTDSCQFFYECEQCKTVLRPLPGDCCVFCSYGSVPCPPVQASPSATAGGCCSGARPPLT